MNAPPEALKNRTTVIFSPLSTILKEAVSHFPFAPGAGIA
jgi:hypothetical protein